MKDKVCIVIPVYNTEKYLECCVNSVLNQTYKNLQIILVDDGSTDTSSILCDELKKKDGRISVVHKKNEGLGLTRNVGIMEANAKYITFLDSDDWIKSNHIENLVNLMNQYKSDLIIGGNCKCSNSGEIFEITELPYYGEFDKIQINDKIKLAIIAAEDTSRKDLGIPMSVCFNLYKLNIIKNNSILFGSEKDYVSEDLFFNLSYLSNSNKVYLSKEKGYFYRFNPVSITRCFDERQIQRTFCYYEKLMNDNNLVTSDKNVKNRIKRSTIAKIRSLLMLLVESNNTFVYKIKTMNNILSNSVTKEVFNEYSLNRYRFSLKITSIFMKHKNILFLYFIFLINKFKKGKI